MATALVLGSTGMVGAHILSTLLESPSAFTTINTISRRTPPTTTTTVPLNPIVSTDTATWPSALTSITPPPTTLFSALATTRGAAGGFENQYKLEHDLNIELAKAARRAGTKAYVLISGANANSKSSLGYIKMKGEIEEHIKELDFEHTVIVQPGLISGKREESRPLEAVFRAVATGLGKISTKYLKDVWAQDADVIARAAVSAAVKIEKGEVKEKVWVLGASEIIKLGRTEWKDLR